MFLATNLAGNCIISNARTDRCYEKISTLIKCISFLMQDLKVHITQFLCFLNKGSISSLASSWHLPGYYLSIWLYFSQKLSQSSFWCICTKQYWGPYEHDRLSFPFIVQSSSWLLFILFVFCTHCAFLILATKSVKK